MSIDDCERVRIAAMAIADGETPGIDREAVDEHLSDCQACRAAVESLDIRSLLPLELERVSLPAQLGDRVRNEIAQTDTLRSVMDQRTWLALAVAACLLIAVSAGVWMILRQPVTDVREPLAGDDLEEQKTPATQGQIKTRNPNQLAEFVPPRTKIKLTYQRIAMQPRAPEDYQRLSSNGKTKVFVSKPEPKTKTPCRLTVFRSPGNEWRKVWAVDAVNPIQPARAYVSDDGKCVVTIGNGSGGPDDTDEQLVIYYDGKLKKRYGLEDILHGYPTADSIPRISVCPGGWWRESFEFVENQQLCLFVDFAQEWFIVDLRRAMLVNVSESARKRCKERARKDIFKTLRRDVEGHHYTTYRRLVRFLQGKDRAIFERLLTQPNSLGLPSGYSDKYYMMSNRERDLAELALQAIDAGKNDAIGNSFQPPFNSQIEFKRLGLLKISASFPRPVRSSDGVIVLWLEPVSGDEKHEPANAIGIDLDYQFPSKLKSAGKPLDLPVTFYFRGVAPGQYRIRGYWDTKTRYKHLIEADYWRRTGQAEVMSGTKVEIIAGKTTTTKVAFE